MWAGGGVIGRRGKKNDGTKCVGEMVEKWGRLAQKQEFMVSGNDSSSHNIFLSLLLHSFLQIPR